MKGLETKEQKSPRAQSDVTVHHILAHSYSFYFLLFLFGFFLDLIFPIKIFHSSAMIQTGFLFLVLASALIIWAQNTSRVLDKTNGVKKETFCKGPYCYTRSPTHWGLFFLMLGFGILINAFFVVVLTFVAFIVTKFVFLRREESILAKKYGAPYLEYKKLVKF